MKKYKEARKNMDCLIVLAVEEIIEINRKFNGGAKRGDLDFIVSRITAAKLGQDFKRDVAKAAAALWYYVIQNHVFVDGNKRTATESVKLFCRANFFEIDLPPNGFIYVSLKIANSDISLQELAELLYEKLRRTANGVFHKT